MNISPASPRDSVSDPADTLSFSLEEYVSRSPEHRRVLEHLGLVPDVAGKESLATQWRTIGLEPRTALRMLEAFDAAMTGVGTRTLELMTPAEICDHLERMHRERVRKSLDEIETLIPAAMKQDGAESSRLGELRNGFESFRARLDRHLKEEKAELFPLIRGANDDARATTWRVLHATVTRMKSDHNEADENLAELSALAADSGAPESIREALARLETIMHEQIYQENQVLFPMVVDAGARRCKARR